MYSLVNPVTGLSSVTFVHLDHLPLLSTTWLPTPCPYSPSPVFTSVPRSFYKQVYFLLRFVIQYRGTYPPLLRPEYTYPPLLRRESHLDHTRLHLTSLGTKSDGKSPRMYRCRQDHLWSFNDFDVHIKFHCTVDCNMMCQCLRGDPSLHSSWKRPRLVLFL